MKKLTATKEFEVRFSEVDSMNIVWHGSYPLYFEDAREEFGRKYGLGYMTIFGNGYFAPLVELSFKYKRPLVYESRPVFDYEIYDRNDGGIIATGRSVQVFMDKDYQLVWENPEFYRQWKEKWEVL